MRENLDKGKHEYGISVNFQKDFHTVDHNILLTKLEHYRICVALLQMIF